MQTYYERLKSKEQRLRLDYNIFFVSHKHTKVNLDV